MLLPMTTQPSHIHSYCHCIQHCRQPMAFLSFFKEHDEVLPAGAYVLPTFCEYCRAPHVSQCRPTCRRPALYFQKKRPPFCKPNAAVWNKDTDDYVPPSATATASASTSPGAGAGGTTLLSSSLSLLESGTTVTSPNSQQKQQPQSWLSIFSTSDGGD